MRTSSIRQSVLRRSSALKNSSAEANTATANPTDLIKPLRDSRTESSSSTIEISGILTMLTFHLWCHGLSVQGLRKKIYYTLVYAAKGYLRYGSYGFLARGMPSFSAILTKSANESACIF